MTELLILLFAVIPVIIFKSDFTKVFPVKIPRMRHITGSWRIWSGTYLIVLLVTQVTMYFFPEGFLEVAEYISDFSQSSSPPVLFIIVCVLASATPFLVLWGAKLLSNQRKKVFTKSNTGIAVALSLMLILVGGLTISRIELNQDPLFVTNMSMDVNRNSSSHSLPINVERADVYELNLAIEIEEGFAIVSIIDEFGLEIFETIKQITLTSEIELVPGNCLFGIRYLFDEDIEAMLTAL